MLGIVPYRDDTSVKTQSLGLYWLAVGLFFVIAYEIANLIGKKLG